MTSCCFPSREEIPTMEIKIEDSCNCCVPIKSKHHHKASEKSNKAVSIAASNLSNIDLTVSKPGKSVSFKLTKKTLTRSPAFYLDK